MAILRICVIVGAAGLLMAPVAGGQPGGGAVDSRLVGDLNCDGLVNDFDITPFVLALTSTPPDYPEYYAQFPNCDHANADINGDGHVDNFDISPFVSLLVQTPPTETELAGNALTSYPFFEYVTAFNQNAPIKLGIDPTQFPDIVGRTADIYVVANKTASQWAADATLVDVRAAGFDTVAFAAGGIQDDTFTIADANELNGDAGTDLGVPYDLVIDMNRDGLLDASDFIDGGGDTGGFYVIRDLTTSGPLAVTEIIYSGGTWLGEDTYYPTTISSLGQLPLVVVSHGNGHDYTWYDYIGFHLASYGYVVMSHQNNTGPGIETASTTTLTNTDYLLGHLATIGGGVLNGHVDSHRITWIGHSRGGEGVVRAYDRLFDGTYTPTNFTINDIVLISSIAPTDFLGPSSSNPHGVNYHLIYGSADGDVGGYPDNDIADSFNVYERSTGFRQVNYVQGASHNDFNCCGAADGTGPVLIGRTEAQKVAKGAFLPLIKHYIEGNVPAKDFLWRQHESLKPIGVAATTIVDREYKASPSGGDFYIDDLQTQSSLSISSSGGAVTFTVTNPFEGIMNDADGLFSWSASDPMNGMTRAAPGDTTRGFVFDWAPGTTPHLDYAVVPAAQDFTQYAYLAFRACQQTRHPQTVGELGDLTFTVTLIDADGHSSSINFGAYLGGIEEPYQRTGYGSGAGWQNEFETIRIRLTDFLRNGAVLDLTRIQTVEFNFGTGFGSSRGRIGFDDLCLSRDHGPGFLTLGLPDGAPVYLAPGETTTIPVTISASAEHYVPGSGLLHYRFDGGTWLTSPLVPVDQDLFEATLPPAACVDTPEFYFSAEGTESGVVTNPPGAPASVFPATVGTWSDFYVQPLDSNPGWISQALWAFGQPTGGGGEYGSHDPTSGYTGNDVYGYNLSGDYENSLPEKHLTSTAVDCTGQSHVRLSFWRWLGVEQPAYDHAYVRLSTNGTAWTTFWENAGEVADSSWTHQELDVSSLADNQPAVYMRWTMGPTDGSWRYCGWNIDDIRLSSFGCD